MTISTTTVSQSYSGNGSTTAFTFPFPINSTSEIKVIERSATGVETVKSVGTGSANYAIVDNGASGGTVTMVTAPAAGTTLVLIRDTSLTQESDYVENDPFAAETHEDALDKLQMQIQEVQEEVDRSMKISRTNTMTSTEFTNSATDRASKVLAFDSSGELSVTQELGTFRGTSATTTTAAYVVRDLVKGSTTAQLNNIYICIQASPIGTALTNTAYWTLIVDAVSAATSATTATTKASAAASSATAAAASETAAETAEAAAETAQTAAEAALDSFDDRYLGAKSSAPSTDNDGNALLTGALYFNSSTSQLFNWTAADAWEAIKPTSTEQTAINALAASAVIADMAILATDAIVADMAILATDAIVADMAILGTDAIVADMAILGTDDVVADMNVLGTADVVTDMNVLGTSANVTAMGLLGTAAVVEDLSILGTSTVVSDMATLAGSGNAPSVTNVTASGTVQFGSLSDGTITITDFVDEDNMASDSAVKIPTQQSVKAYVDSQTSGSLSLIDEDNMATDSATRPPSQQSVKAFAESLTGTNIVATGALNAGTITSGFGNINTGASTITTTGEIAAGSLDISGNIDVDGTTNLDVVDIDGALTQDGGAVFNEASADVDFRIESNGNANMLFVNGGDNKVFVGGTGPTYGQLGIENAGDTQIDLFSNVGSGTEGKAEIFFSTDTSSDHLSVASIVMQQDGAGDRKGEILLNVSDNGGPATAVTVQNNKNVIFGGSIGLGGTGSANLLDDYEEGTWTPSGPSLGVATNHKAIYRKIGDIVVAYCDITYDSSPADTAQATSMSGLPFSSNDAYFQQNTRVASRNQNIRAEVGGTSVAFTDVADGVIMTRSEFAGNRTQHTFIYTTA